MELEDLRKKRKDLERSIGLHIAAECSNFSSTTGFPPKGVSVSWCYPLEHAFCESTFSFACNVDVDLGKI